MFGQINAIKICTLSVLLTVVDSESENYLISRAIVFYYKRPVFHRKRTGKLAIFFLKRLLNVY